MTFLRSRAPLSVCEHHDKWNSFNRTQVENPPSTGIDNCLLNLGSVSTCKQLHSITFCCSYHAALRRETMMHSNFPNTLRNKCRTYFYNHSNHTRLEYDKSIVNDFLLDSPCHLKEQCILVYVACIQALVIFSCHTLALKRWLLIYCDIFIVIYKQNMSMFLIVRPK